MRRIAIAFAIALTGTTAVMAIPQVGEQQPPVQFKAPEVQQAFYGGYNPFAWRAVPLYLVPISSGLYQPRHSGPDLMAGLRRICRPAPSFGPGYQLCLAGADIGETEMASDAPEALRPKRRDLDQPSYEVASGPFRFCPSTDWAGTGYGIFCI
jgi:hypothetical protein